MQPYYHAMYRTDDWHLAYMFPLVYFSVEVCVSPLCLHKARSLLQGLCTLHTGSPLPYTRKQNRTRGDPALHLNQARGHLKWHMGLACIMGGNMGCRIISTEIVHFMGCVLGRIHYGLKVVFCFRHLLPSIIVIMQDYSQALNTYVCRVSCGGVFNMLLVLSITCYLHYNILGCMCSTGPFPFMWLKGYFYCSCNYNNQIGSIHLSHCYNIFRGCVPEMFVTSYPVTYCRENQEIVFIISVQCMMSADSRNALACRSYSFVWALHHLIIIIVQANIRTL